MPKVLVLLVDADHDAAHAAAAAFEGATSVRFTEVDLRATLPCEPIAGRQCRQLEATDRVLEYDGLVVVAADSKSASLARFVQEVAPLAGRGAFANVVMAVTTGRGAPSIDSIAPLGSIVATSASGSDAATEIRGLAARVAKVAAWVRHSLDHEHQDHHHQHDARSEHGEHGEHHHSRGHAHDHHHAHGSE